MRWIQHLFILVIVVGALTAGKAANYLAMGLDKAGCAQPGTHVERADVHASPGVAARPAVPVLFVEGPRPVVPGVMPVAPIRLHAVGCGVMRTAFGSQPPVTLAAGMVMRV